MSSSSTHSEVESLKDLIDNEEIRYQRKGYGLIMAAVMTFFFFVFLPELLYPLYAWLPHTNLFLLSTLGVYTVHFVVFFIANLGMYVIYVLELPFFERYKIMPGAWPWKKDPERFRKLLKKTAVTLLVNQGLILPLAVVLSFYLGTTPFISDLALYPDWKAITVQILFFMIVEDTVFYWVHRTLHRKEFYSLIHKQHHEYKVTLGITTEYAHPLEFLLANVIPMTVGPSILGKCHIVTYWMWLLLRILETTDGHCGYEFSWSPFRLLPLSGSASYHNFHHSQNVGNFGSFFTYWDTICKTNAQYWKYLARSEKTKCS